MHGPQTHERQFADVCGDPTSSAMTTVTGYLVEPDLTPRRGQKIRMQSLLVPPDGARPRTRLLTQDMGGALLFLESITPAGAHVHGSAFLVAPGIALTAYHTIRDWQEAGHFGESDHCIFAGGTNHAGLRVWEVRSCCVPMGGGDVALLVLAPRFEIGDEVTICHFSLAASWPALGSEVTTLGMRLDPNDAVLPLISGEHQLPDVSVVTITSSGKVIDRYMGGIPRIAAPCFATDACAVGGMSGGPVFDEQGYVVGIVSESIGADDPDDYISFSSVIWPAALFEFEGIWPQRMFGPNSQLRDQWVRDGWRVFGTSAGHLAYLEGGSPDFIGPPNLGPGVR